MKTKALIFILLLGLVMAGCKKSKYTETTVGNQPVFYFKATLDGTPVKLLAGIDDYYLYATHQKDSAGLYGFSGTFQQITCPGCGPRLQVLISDYKIVNGNNVVMDSALQLKNYSYMSNVSYNAVYDVAFKSSYNKTAASRSWSFGDGTFSTDQDPVHTYQKAGSYAVCLKVTGADGCENSVCNTEIIRDKTLRTAISAMPIGDSSVKFTQTTVGKAPFTYVWTFGDGVRSLQQHPTHRFPFTGGYPVKLKVKDADGDSIVTRFNAVTPDDVSSCAANYVVSQVTRRGILPLSQVLITWTDAAGQVYSSRSGPQDQDAFFKILDIADYKENENGEKAKKIHAVFKCKLYKGSSFIRIDEGEAVIAVSHP
jgi:PKD repeat protein